MRLLKHPTAAAASLLALVTLALYGPGPISHNAQAQAEPCVGGLVGKVVVLKDGLRQRTLTNQAQTTFEYTGGPEQQFMLTDAGNQGGCQLYYLVEQAGKRLLIAGNKASNDKTFIEPATTVDNARWKILRGVGDLYRLTDALAGRTLISNPGTSPALSAYMPGRFNPNDLNAQWSITDLSPTAPIVKSAPPPPQPTPPPPPSVPTYAWKPASSGLPSGAVAYGELSRRAKTLSQRVRSISSQPAYDPYLGIVCYRGGNTVGWMKDVDGDDWCNATGVPTRWILVGPARWVAGAAPPTNAVRQASDTSLIPCMSRDWSGQWNIIGTWNAGTASCDQIYNGGRYSGNASLSFLVADGPVEWLPLDYNTPSEPMYICKGTDSKDSLRKYVGVFDPTSRLCTYARAQGRFTLDFDVRVLTLVSGAMTWQPGSPGGPAPAGSATAGYTAANGSDVRICAKGGGLIGWHDGSTCYTPDGLNRAPTTVPGDAGTLQFLMGTITP